MRTIARRLEAEGVLEILVARAENVVRSVGRQGTCEANVQKTPTALMMHQCALATTRVAYGTVVIFFISFIYILRFHPSGTDKLGLLIVTGHKKLTDENKSNIMACGSQASHLFADYPPDISDEDFRSLNYCCVLCEEAHHPRTCPLVTRPSGIFYIT